MSCSKKGEGGDTGPLPFDKKFLLLLDRGEKNGYG